MRHAARLLIAILLLAVLALGAVAIRLRGEDPYAALPRAAREATLVEMRAEPEPGRVLLHTVLDEPAVGRIRFILSLPDPLPPGPLPVVVVLGGLRTGADRVRALGDPGPNAVLAFEWPLPRDVGLDLDLVRNLPRHRREALSAPGQVDAILRWAVAQPWADGERVSLLGFSLGALIAPAAQRLAEERGATIGWTILAYAGAPIGALVEAHPRLRPPWARGAIAAAADLVLRPLEPTLHLPHVRGRFLVLGASADSLVPALAAARLRDATPQPRTDLVVDGGHVGVGKDRLRLLRQVADLAHGWLAREGAIASP